MRYLNLVVRQPEVSWFVYLYVLNALGLFQPGFGEFLGRFIFLAVLGPIITFNLSKQVIRKSQFAKIRFNVLNFLIFLVAPWIPFVSGLVNLNDSSLLLTQMLAGGFSLIGALMIMFTGWLTSFFIGVASFATIASGGNFNRFQGFRNANQQNSAPRDVTEADFVEVKAERIT